MKAHQIETPDENMAKLQNIYKTQLQKQFNIGFSYGGQAFCQVVKDKINGFTGQDMSVLIADISNFVDTTLKNSPQTLQKALEDTQKRVNHMLGKDDVNE